LQSHLAEWRPLTRCTTEWKDIYGFLRLGEREITHERNTNETKIRIRINLDGKGKANIKTGLHFFDHMLDQLSRHSGMDLDIAVNGDLQVDEHHTIEDTAIALGEAMALALGNKLGISRYGFTLPMDDALAQVAIDFGGRGWLVWNAVFMREKIGDMPTEMFYHFFKSYADAAKCNLNISVTGDNEHHKIESIFKAWARAIRMALQRDVNNPQLPSTKGIL
jgi:imidazoleglycerol-phosphate dehydratase/histidinol-phosphatase